MRHLILPVGVITVVFSALYWAFAPVLAPALAYLLGALK